MDPEPRLRRGLLTRTLFEILRDAGEPLAAKDAVAGVKARLTLNQRELSPNDSGVPRFETDLRWVSSWSSAIGWMAKRGGWSLTEAGIEALDEFPGDELANELTQRYRLHRKHKQQKSSGYQDPRWARVVTALSYVEAGWWTSYGDLAGLTGLPTQSIGRFLATQPVENAHRALRSDGTIAPDFRWPDPDRDDDPRQILEREGLRFDDAGRADPDHRLTTEDLREQLIELDTEDTAEPPTRQAWLVRGSSVAGHDLVHLWLHEKRVSLAAANLPPVELPVPTKVLKELVEQHYRQKSYAARDVKVTEFDAFCNRMRVGDYLLTTTQGRAYLGRITGEASYTASEDQRSNLRREVEWLNPSRPVPFAQLPDPLPAKLHSQDDVVELTDVLDSIETLLENLGIPTAKTDSTPAKSLRFPPIGQDFADQQLIDRDWLQQQADVLWERKQMIFYGPPGTGKTYLARKLAEQLADVGAVKLVQFHPSYTYEDFFEGFRPVQDSTEQLRFTLQGGPFRKLVDAAREHPSDPYILVIDEINRANLAKVFGELYFLLEYRDFPIGLLYSSESEFTMPPNIFVIGTMNTTDRSIALVDAAMRRRFAFVELHPAHPPTKGLLTAWLRRAQAADQELTHNLDAPAVLDTLNARITDRELAVGPSYLMREQIYRHESGLEREWQTSILPLLAEHHYGAPDAVLDQYRLESLRQELAAQQPSDGTPP